MLIKLYIRDLHLRELNEQQLDEVHAEYHRLGKEAAALVADHKDVITRLARRLAELGRMTGRQIDAVLLDRIAPDKYRSPRK